MGRKILFTILILFFFTLILTTIAIIRKTVEEEVETNHDLSEYIGSVLENDIKPDIQEFSSMISNLIEEDDAHYNLDIQQLHQNISPLPIDDVSLQGKRSDTIPYRGLYVNDLRDARWALAHIDRVKSVGFDTILFEVQQEVQADNKTKLYVPAENVYLFYLNAFNKAGFRLWLTIGHTSYSFPYRKDSDNERIGIDPLEDQTDLLDLVTPNILHWADIAEKYNVDTFIPEEEANTMLFTDEYQGTDLCQKERNLMNEWMHSLLPQINERFTGKVGFATNDGGPCEIMGTSDTRLGPDFDYTGYDFILYKYPFRSVFETDEMWDIHTSYAIPHTISFVERDNVKGLILYESGDSVGKPLDADFAGSLPVRNTNEKHQKESYQKYFKLLKGNNEILGLFFKISDQQPHEPSWNPFDKPSEKVLINNFAPFGIIPPHDLDELWTSIGEEGLKAIQACISSEIPFDPEHELHEVEYENFYNRVRSVCMVFED